MVKAASANPGSEKELESMRDTLQDMVAHTYDPRTWEVATGTSVVQTHPQLHTELKAPLRPPETVLNREHEKKERV